MIKRKIKINPRAKREIDRYPLVSVYWLEGLSFLWQEMRDAAKWEYDSANNEADRKANLAIAALGNESVQDQSKANFIKNLGEFAFKIWEANR